MRIGIELKLDHELIDKDKNRIMLHLIKSVMWKTDKELYKQYYETNSRKDFTFTTYLGRDVKFLRDYIHIPRRKINLNISAYDDGEMTRIYHCFNNAKNKVFIIHDNIVRVGDIKVMEEAEITGSMTFRTLSPISVREHDGDNKNTWYHDIETEEGKLVFLRNLKYQIKQEMNEELDIQINIKNNKIIKVKHYGIIIPANKCDIEMNGDKKQIEHLYKAGIGSNKSSGFGMLTAI